MFVRWRSIERLFLLNGMEKKQSPSVDDHALVKMEKSVFRGMKKKRGSKKLVVRGVTHWIKFEDDIIRQTFLGVATYTL